jgi:phosphohistidine phosphatase SixA
VITVLLVRHADIDLPPGTADPGLNDAGRERARALAHVVGPAGVTTVFTSSFARTKQTAAPTLAVLGVGARQMPDAAVVAQEVRSGELGGVVLIVGHSNTVPEVIGALGVPAPLPVIGETQFDNLFVVTLGEPTGASLLALKYAKPSA